MQAVMSSEFSSSLLGLLFFKHRPFLRCSLGAFILKECDARSSGSDQTPVIIRCEHADSQREERSAL